MRALNVVCAGLLLFATLGPGARGAHAEPDEERLRLMDETVSFTEVADAFDEDDRFDLDVHLGYARSREQGAIYREQTRADGALVVSKVGDARHEVSRLALGLDVGLFRDLMAFARLPLVLSDAREITGSPGGAAALAAGEGEALFGLPFEAPRRAGLEYLAFGAAYALLNQTRSPWLPTWVLRIEGRRALGRPLAPCRTLEAGSRCGSGAQPGGSAEPGASRDVSGLQLETRFSRRYRQFEPYAGLSLLLEWPAAGSGVYRPARSRELPRGRPGPETGATLGIALVPWENRGTFQRAVFDLRLGATFVARGTDVTALFDALGSTSHPELAAPRFEGSAPCPLDPALPCGVGAAVRFDGRTESAPHLRSSAQLSVEVQAARYVRFVFGSRLQWSTDHALTGRAPCAGATPRDATLQLGDDGRRCTSGGIDPRHRGILDAPGRRFVLRDSWQLELFAHARAMF